MRFNTFSIAAYDPAAHAWGVAVASKFLAAPAIVNWAQAGAGAIATQAFAKVSFGVNGLRLLAEGRSAEDVLAALLADDPDRGDRQVGIVDAQGNVAAHTGADCFEWAGHRLGEGFTCQGNILTGPETLDAMADTFTNTSGELADRLLAALLAADTVGGDRRGKQSAGILVVRPDGGYGGDNDRYMDLRVDDDPEPVQRLQALVELHHLFFGDVQPEDLIPIDATLARELQALLRQEGYYTDAVHGQWDDASQEAFWALVGNENLEARWAPDESPDQIDRVTLTYLRQRFSQ
jgi:uncharacterized Ntn-hydrolase superfamily protein